MRRYEYTRIKRGFPMWPRREPGNDPASPTVPPGSVEKTGQGATISISEYTSDGNGGIRIISEETI